MDLPFIVEFAPPGRAAMHRALRHWWIWGIGVALAGSAAGVLLLQRPQPGPESVATLEVATDPSGAAIEVDGHGVAHAPAQVELSAGDHRVTLRLGRYLDATYSVHLETAQTADLNASMWVRDPTTTRLRPTFPGAQISRADFLGDGRIALTIAIPAGDERQLWLLNSDGRLVHVEAPGARGSIALTPDGKQLAFLAASQTSAFSSVRTNQIWTGGPQGASPSRRYVLPIGRSNDQLSDLSWAPDGQHLLATTREQLVSGTARTRFLWMTAASGEPSEILTLPSDLVPGSYSWSPDGEWVAFLARSGQTTSLCLLAPARGEFRYVADLGKDAAPLAFAPVAWSPDGRQLLYAAPAQDRPLSSGWLFGGKNPVSLFIADRQRPPGRRLGQIEALAPVWLDDGRSLALAQPKGSSVPLREIGADGSSRDISQITISNVSSFAARWDAKNAQVLLATRASGGLGSAQTDYWLVRFRPEAQP